MKTASRKIKDFATANRRKLVASVKARRSASFFTLRFLAVCGLAILVGGAVGCGLKAAKPSPVGSEAAPTPVAGSATPRVHLRGDAPEIRTGAESISI